MDKKKDLGCVHAIWAYTCFAHSALTHPYQTKSPPVKTSSTFAHGWSAAHAHGIKGSTTPALTEARNVRRMVDERGGRRRGGITTSSRRSRFALNDGENRLRQQNITCPEWLCTVYSPTPIQRQWLLQSIWFNMQNSQIYQCRVTFYLYKIHFCKFDKKNER